MSRLPIRLRLTLVFALALAAVLAGGGFALYGRLASSLDRTLDAGLRARAADVAALVGQSDTGLRESPAANGSAQVLDTRGHVVDSTPGLPRPLLAPAQVERARRGTLWIGRALVGGDATRLLARPVHAQDTQLVVVVGAPLAVRDQALADLRRELLTAGPVALLLASLGGYLVAGAAFRPVERMRARAAEISTHTLSERLPVPPADDEIGALGTTFNALLDRLEAGVRRERRLVADASHELRTPLALLGAEVELALERPRSHAELRAALESARAETDRLTRLAEGLLLLARLDEGRPVLRTRPVALADVLDRVARRFDEAAAAEHRRIEVDETTPTVEADDVRLEQAVGNLVENALRHGAGTVRLSGVRRGETVEVHVADEGDGIPASFAPRAFERFSRVDEARSGPGAGLGLALVRAIAEAHGGTAGAAGADVWLSVAATDSPRPRAPTRDRRTRSG